MGLSYISELKAQGQLDLDFADSLISDNRAILDATGRGSKADSYAGRTRNKHRARQCVP